MPLYQPQTLIITIHLAARFLSLMECMASIYIFFSVGLVDEQNLELFLGVPATCSDFAANIQGRFS